jgi:hypothetical protein
MVSEYFLRKLSWHPEPDQQVCAEMTISRAVRLSKARSDLAGSVPCVYPDGRHLIVDRVHAFVLPSA